jgi:hypothetical protein
MFVQLALGSALMLTILTLSGVGLWRVELARRRQQDWISKAPHAPKLILLFCAAAARILGIVTFGVRLWALTVWALGPLPVWSPPSVSRSSPSRRSDAGICSGPMTGGSWAE